MVAAVDEESRRRLRLALRALAAAAVLAVGLSAVAVVVSVVSSETRAAEVAERVAPEVIRQVVADSRAQRAANARGVLAAANSVLADRGLPMVADPGPQANAEEILAAASSAQVLSVLPESIVEQLRDELDGQPLMLPSATVSPPETATTPPIGSGGGATTGPGEPGGPSSSGGDGAPSTSGPGAAPPGRPPAVAPPSGGQPPSPDPTRRRLIPPLVPIPGLPLIGT